MTSFYLLSRKPLEIQKDSDATDDTFEIWKYSDTISYQSHQESGSRVRQTYPQTLAKANPLFHHPTEPTAWSPCHGSCRFRRTPAARLARARAARAARAPGSRPAPCEPPSTIKRNPKSMPCHNYKRGQGQRLQSRSPPAGPSRGARTSKSVNSSPAGPSRGARRSKS